MTGEDWRAQLAKEGFTDIAVHTFPPNTRFGVHTHEEDSVHVMLEGELTLVETGDPMVFRKGDRINIPAGTTHDAYAGPDGFTFLVGVKK
jgi:quercetin dioxygenase-like cupin family protein